VGRRGGPSRASPSAGSPAGAAGRTDGRTLGDLTKDTRTPSTLKNAAGKAGAGAGDTPLLRKCAVVALKIWGGISHVPRRGHGFFWGGGG